MQIKKELAEMHDASVQLISLVETGANAAPFKRLKSEEPEGGIDVFRAEKLQTHAAEVPQLIALAVSPKGDVEAAKAIAKAAGVEIQETREVEGDDGKTTLLLARKQDRVNTGDPNQIQIYLDEELTAVCRVEKTFLPFNGSTSFSEAIKAQGYFPQLRNALDVFGEVAFHILDSADSPNAAATKISKASEELGKLLTLMTKALPKETFKMAEVIKVLKAEGGEGTETLASKEDEETEAKAKEEAEAKAKADAEAEVKAKADADAEAKAKAKADHDDEEDEDAKAAAAKAKKPAKKEVVEDEESDALAQVLKAIATLTTTVEKQGEAQAELKKEVEAVAEKADAANETATAAEETATAADEAVTGRVSTSAAPDGRGREERVSKGAPPLMDTGMSRYRARGGVN